MKRAVYLIISLLLVSGSMFRSGFLSGSSFGNGNDSIKVFAAPELSKLANSWADTYNSTNSGPKIQIVKVADNAQAEELIRQGKSGFIGGDKTAALKTAGWNVIIGRDVIVPIINSQNPNINDIKTKGVSTAALAAYFTAGGSGKWSSILKGAGDQSAMIYILNDATLEKSLVSFLRIDENRMTAARMNTAGELINAIRKDACALGFCRFAELIDPSTKEIIAGITLLPFDRNGNGLIDYSEKISDNAAAFGRGVWIGKYPRALVTNIYAVSSAKPGTTKDLSFMKWILTDGQKFLPDNGFTDLIASECTSAIDGMNAIIPQQEIHAGISFAGIFMFVITAIILAGAVTAALARQRKQKKVVVSVSADPVHSVLAQEALAMPGGIYYDKTHTWAFMEESGTVRIGIDDFLQHITGRITRIRMKQVGNMVKKGESILSIVQNGKQLNLYAPVSGTIVEHNTVLESDSTYLNTSPYRNGWIYRIEPSNWIRESQLLFMAEKQREFLKKEFLRLKDFLMNALKSDPNYALLMLQDGGEIADGVLSEMGPEVWEDFQTSFIDPSRQVWFYELF